MSKIIYIIASFFLIFVIINLCIIFFYPHLKTRLLFSRKSIIALCYATLMVMILSLIPLATVIFFSLINTLATKEIFDAVEKKLPESKDNVNRYVAYGLTGLLPFIVYLLPQYISYIILFYLTIVVLTPLFRQDTQFPYIRISASLMSFIFALAMCSYVVIKTHFGNPDVAILLFSLIFMNDCFASFVGICVGKIRFISQVSPNKILEGTLAALLITVIFSYIYKYILGLNIPNHYLLMIVLVLFWESRYLWISLSPYFA